MARTSKISGFQIRSQSQISKHGSSTNFRSWILDDPSRLYRFHYILKFDIFYRFSEPKATTYTYLHGFIQLYLFYPASPHVRIRCPVVVITHYASIIQNDLFFDTIVKWLPWVVGNYRREHAPDQLVLGLPVYWVSDRSNALPAVS